MAMKRASGTMVAGLAALACAAGLLVAAANAPARGQAFPQTLRRPERSSHPMAGETQMHHWPVSTRQGSRTRQSASVSR
jgi:hypothetical protein